MTDQYPVNFSVDFDRQQLTTYYRVHIYSYWAVALSFVGFITGANCANYAIQRGHHTFGGSMLYFLFYIGSGVIVGMLLAIPAYYVLGHRLAVKHANRLEVTVEGPFLRVRQNYPWISDRKIHFRNIVDYTTVQGPFLRRFNLFALHMATTSTGLGSTITVLGVKDCYKVQDMLSEVDQLRENS
jgi:membrane protein YdbS with pleckstrin-like domain